MDLQVRVPYLQTNPFKKKTVFESSKLHFLEVPSGKQPHNYGKIDQF